MQMERHTPGQPRREGLRVAEEGRPQEEEEAQEEEGAGCLLRAQFPRQAERGDRARLAGGAWAIAKVPRPVVRN
eukprot:5077326-Alexandrium_andersonii.AAC.1